MAEFLDAERNAACSGIDKPKFKTLLEQLAQLPAVKERLLFEMLNEVSKCLEHECEPVGLVAWIRVWSDSVGKEKVPELLTQTESIIFRYFDCLPQIASSEPALTLPMLCDVVRERDPARIGVIVEGLKQRCNSTTSDPRLRIVAELERSL